MIRITLLTLLIAYLSVYAWKDWFRAACWLIILMSIFQHPDMPKSIAGIPGLNHWNFLFLNTVLSWFSNRKKQKLSWEMPAFLNSLLFLYGFFICVSVIRYLFDHSGVNELFDVIGGEPLLGAKGINEYIINCFKWVLPGIIIFDGCRERKQYNFAILAVGLLYVLLALQVVKAMKLGSLTMGGDALQRKALKIISDSVGFHRVNISMMMSGAFWAVFCLKQFASSKQYWLIILPSCLIIFLAMAMTGGRTGYATWAILGLVFIVFKWRKYLLVIPLLVLIIPIVAPSAIDRLTEGFSPDEALDSRDADFQEDGVDLHLITSGRIFLWPLVIESIEDAPLFGHGRNSTQNEGITLRIIQDYGKGEVFPHPHNAYLEWMQDNGYIGALPVFLFYILILKYSWSLFRDNTNNLYVVTGGAALALLGAFLIASMGSQTFYPREGAVGMWAIIGIVLRVHIERKKVLKGIESSLLDK
jgi:O-antigen ligase